MKVNKPILLVALIALFTCCWAQRSDEKAKRSDAILNKIRHLDLLNHILPLTLTKEQIGALLPVIEKCRQSVRKIELMEHDDLVKFESKIDKAVEDGIKKDLVPGRELLNELNKLILAFRVRRQVAIGENVDLVLPVVKKEFNKGQIAVAANSLDPKAFGMDPEKMTEDDRLKLYIRDILLDMLAYDLLIRLQKGAP